MFVFNIEMLCFGIKIRNENCMNININKINNNCYLRTCRILSHNDFLIQLK